MTLTTQAWGYDGLTYTGKDMRELVEGLVGVDGITTTPGFTLGFKASAQGSPNATVSVALGWVHLLADGAGLGGMYHFYNDAALTSPAFDPTAGDPRWDYLVLRVTAGVPALEIIKGTPNAIPTAPAITGDNKIPIALVKITAGTTNITNAMINDARVFVGKWAQPWGVLGHSHASASQAVNAETDLTGVSVSVTVAAHRLVKITVFGQGHSTTQTIYWTMYIKEGAAYLNGGQNTSPAIGNPAAVEVFAIVDTGTSPGAHTYKAAALTGSAGGESMYTANGPKAWILVEDIGPAANPD